MARKGNKTGEWARQHLNDPYVKKATSEGYRSRAVYKFQEIEQQDKLIRSGMLIADLGSAPGGWSQYIARRWGDRVKLVAVDLLEMDPLDKVRFIQGDFQDQSVLNLIDEFAQGQRFDLVISDMAPNITGVRSSDEAQYEALLDSVFDFCEARLKPGGNLLVKLFEGSAAHYYRREVKTKFKRGVVRKPKASRPKSREYYFLSTGFKPSKA